MNLDEFIERTLSEILAGIRAAQSKDGGSAVGAGAEVKLQARQFCARRTIGHFHNRGF
jgi:hypothetical protein